MPFIGSLDSFVKTLITIAFAMTLMQYVVSVPLGVGPILPLFLLVISASCALLRTSRSYFLRNLLSGGAVLFPFFVFFDIVAYYSGNSASFLYGVVLLVIFICMRLILLQIGFLEVVHCYINSAVFCTAAILISGREQISDYQVGQVNRFTGGSGAHPDLLGFTFVSYLALFLGVYFDTSSGIKRYVMIGAAAATVFILFLAGSRGSLIAAIAPFIVLFFRFAVFRKLAVRIKIAPSKILFGLLALTIAAVYGFGKGHLASVVHFFVTALALDSDQRGIHSGLSGRSAMWTFTLGQIKGLQWIFGFGYRQSYFVDNGYITVLFDNGVLGLALIAGSMIKLFFWFWRETNVITSWGWWRYRVVMLTLIISYLVNNVSARYLFSYGNQFSVLMMFMMLSTRADLIGGPVAKAQIRDLQPGRG